MLTTHDVLLRPLVTEKGINKKEAERTICFQVAADANKIQITQAVEALFEVKVEAVRTANFEGKLRRRGRFSGYRSDWKKAYVKLADGEKVPEFTEI
jgi:large subunit ribosomal protein L23